MPVCYSPDETFPVKIETLDGGMPDDQRVVFMCRALTVAETRKVRAMRLEALDKKTDAEMNDGLNAAILLGVKAWNRPEPMTADGLDEALTLDQKDTIAQFYPAELTLSELEKKASRLRRTSGPESSQPATSAPTNA